MMDDKFISLVNKIDKKTAAGDLSWEKTVSDQEFQANLASFVIRIRLEMQGPEPDYILTLVDKSGVELETISDVYLSGLLKNTFSAETGFTLMERIFKSAKRKALGLDKIIDKLISELDNEIAF